MFVEQPRIITLIKKGVKIFESQSVLERPPIRQGLIPAVFERIAVESSESLNDRTDVPCFPGQMGRFPGQVGRFGS